MLAVGNILMRGSGTRMWSRWIYTFWVNVSCFLGNPCRIWSGWARKKKHCNSLLLFNWLSIMDICKHHDYKIQNKESIRRCVCVCVCSVSVMSDSLLPHGLQPFILLYPFDFQGKNTGTGCHFLLQGIVPTQWVNCVSCIAGRVFTTEPLEKSHT